MTHRPCGQKQCVFNQGIEGCRACAECQAPPNVIKKDCSVCLACENIPEMQRWDDGSKGVNPAVKNKIVIEIEIVPEVPEEEEIVELEEEITR